VRVWYDEGISPGSEWSDALARKIEQSAVFLYFVTPRSVNSEHCRREVSFALGKPCRILSVHLVPTELPSGLALSLSNRQAILKQEESRTAYEGKLLRAIGGAGSQDDIASSSSDSQNLSADSRRPATLAVAAAVFVAILAGITVWVFNRPTNETHAFDRSLAVLPFSVVGADSEAATYAQILTEELRTEVTGYQELRIVETTTAAYTRGPSDATYVVTGSVQRLGDDVRVRVNLMRADDHETAGRWNFEQPNAAGAADVTETATTIGLFVRGRLAQEYQCESVRRATRSTEAATAYCEALKESSRFGFEGNWDVLLQLSLAKRAVELDPEIADAYRLLAGTYRFLATTGVMDWQEAEREARDALDRGLTLEPNDPTLLNERGLVLETLTLDYPAAETSFRASLASDPLHPNAGANYLGLGMLANARGNLREALENYRRASRIYEDGINKVVFAGSLLFAGNNREAVDVADAGINLVDTGPGRFYLLAIKATALHDMGQSAEANAAVDSALASVGPGLRPWLAGPLALVGRTQQAQELLGELESLKPPPIEPMVLAYAALGDERVFEWIHKAIDQRIWGIVGTLRVHPVFSELRNDPRWTEVMAHLEAEEAEGRSGDRSQK
jgi:tetratricopeptide (TPR) repeat protein/TolB-like protein